MGLLDDFSGASGGGSPWGAFYPSPLNQPDPQALAAQYAAAGIDPSAMPQQSPFGPVPNLTPNSPAAAPGFGAGATPFSFAGPGSMNAAPSQIAPAPAAPAPASANVATSPQPDRYVSVGNYQMPQFGNAPPMSLAGPQQPSAQPQGAPQSSGGLLGSLANGINWYTGHTPQGASSQRAAAPSSPQNPASPATTPQLQNILPPRPNILWPRQS